MAKLNKKTKKQLLNIGFVLILVGITLTILLLSYQELNFKNIFSFIGKSKKWMLVLAVLCMVAGIAFEGFSLFVISRRLGHRGKLISAMAYSSADIYYSAITPSASGGQPASAYYMAKDGMNVGTASFTLVFNTVAYTASLIVLTVFAIILRPSMFIELPVTAKVLVIIGIVVQAVLLLLLFACMHFHRAVLKIANGFISLLYKIKIIKNLEKWRNSAENAVEKYSSCYQETKKHKTLFIEALSLNIGQRVMRIVCACLVCMSVDTHANFWSLFALQSFVIVGYTSLPLPGGVGVFEYLYISVYGIIYSDSAFILSAMMIMRTITYYLSIVVSGAFILSYHMIVTRRVKTKEITSENIVSEENSLQNNQDTDNDMIIPPPPKKTNKLPNCALFNKAAICRQVSV